MHFCLRLLGWFPSVSALPATKTAQRQATYKQHIKVNQVGKRKDLHPFIKFAHNRQSVTDN